MLKVIEITLTVISISLGVFEVLGRTDVIAARTPTESLRDAFSDGDAQLVDPSASITPSPDVAPIDLTLEVERCEYLEDSAFIDVAVHSDVIVAQEQPVQIEATGGDDYSIAETALINNSLGHATVNLALLRGSQNQVVLKVDPANAVVETNEDNNEVALTVEVPEDPFAPSVDICD